MERITVHSKFHTGHRQIGFPGKCRFVHGHTWRGTINILTEEFPRDDIDMSIDFGDLKKIMRDLDHKILAVPSDKEFTNPDLFEPEGVVVLEAKGPSVEVVAYYVWDKVVELIRHQYPNRNKTYEIEVEIQETDNNFFAVKKNAII